MQNEFSPLAIEPLVDATLDGAMRRGMAVLAPGALIFAAAETNMNHPGWRRTLRRELAWLMTLKIAALALLWWLFFSPAHRSPVDGRAASRRFAVAASTVGAPPPAYAREEQRP